MRKIFCLLAVSILGLYSCSSNKTQSEKQEESVAGVSGNVSTDVPFKNVENYFSTQRPEELQVLILNESDFNKYFHPAKTMNNVLTKIDFAKEMVGAIILPETEYNTTISINKASLTGKTLTIDYTITKDQNKQSYTIVPSRVFTFDQDLVIDTINFKNGDSEVRIAVK